MSAPSAADLAAASRVVRETVAMILPGLAPQDIRGDRHPRDLGADSVDRVEIIMTVLERTGVRRPMSDFNDLRDLDALVAVLCTPVGD